MKRAVALLLALALVLTAVGSLWWALADSETPTPGTSGAPSAAVAPTLGSGTGLERFLTQRITWTGCPGGECARVEVPLDYSDPDGETITLSMLKVASSRADAPALLVNPGGPGGSAMEYAQLARITLGRVVTDHFDVIGLDPRGVGQSTPIDCVSDEELDAWIATDPTPDDTAEVAASQRGQADFRAGCRARSGALVDHVTTTEAARDMDVVRAVLGESQLHYFGASYGTKLGAVYASLFPERVGKFVLDGAMDPRLDTLGVSLGQAQGFGRALAAWADDYVASCEGCELGSDRATVLVGVEQLLGDIEREPLPASGRELTVGNAFYGIAMPLYNQDYWPMLTDALLEAREGDGTGLLTNSDYYSGRSPSGYLGNSMEANYAINCADDPRGLSPAEVEAQLPAFEQAAGTLGAGLAWGMTACSSSDARSTEEPVTIKAAGAAPILVIGTTRDPATPYQWAVALAEQLDSAVLLTRDGDGHTGFQAGNTCVDTTVEGYLTGTATPDAPINC